MFMGILIPEVSTENTLSLRYIPVPVMWQLADCTPITGREKNTPMQKIEPAHHVKSDFLPLKG